MRMVVKLRTMKTKKTLTKLKLINWHYFNNETINLKNTNLFSGDNGAGKSTILDAIQLILTTNSRKFNIAANTESKRSLKSYVRGKTGEEGNEYLRKGAVISFIALEVYEEAKQRYFVLGAKFDSTDLESDVKRKWFCEEGTLDQLSFIIDNKPSKDDQFRNNGKKVTFIQQTTAAKDKFKHRLGHLQDNFFELLSRSLAFKPMKDVKSFVSQFILPEKSIDIDALRENIRNLKEMMMLVEEVKKQVKDLEKIQNTYDDILNIDAQILVIDILIKIAEEESKKEIIEKITKQKNLTEQNIAQDTKLSNELEHNIEGLNKQYIDILSALNSGKTAQLIGSIENEINSKQKDRDTLSGDIQKLNEQLKRIRSSLKYVMKYRQLNLNKILSLKNDEIEIQNKNSIVIEVESAFSEVKKLIQDNLTDKKAELASITQRIEQLSKEIKDLERNKITYDRNVITLKEAIEHEFSARGIDSEVRILSDLLEISNSKWQDAVEGYLNSQRFHIIVEPQYYDLAAEVYARNKSRIHTAAVVNTAKLKTDISPDDNSLASVVICKNIHAHAYVCYLLGRVIMCENVSQLKEHNIAITQGCMLYQGNALRKINPEIYRMPYIGKYALVQQLKLKKEEYEEKSNQQKELSEQKEIYKDASETLDKCIFEILKDVIGAPVKYKIVNEEIRHLERKLQEAKKDPTFLQLEMQSDEMGKQLKDLRKDLYNKKDKISRSNFEKEQLIKEIKHFENEINSIKAEIDELVRGNESELSDANKKYEENKKTKSADTIFSNYQPRKSELSKQKTNCITTLIGMQAQYKNCELGTGIEMMTTYTEEYNTLAKHDLIRYEEKLRVIRDNCETEFRESFLAKMRENIENAISLFKELNKTLKPIYYGNDSYRFDWTADKRKKRLYEMIMSDFNLGGFNLFSTQFDEKYHDEMDELFTKLTVSDQRGDDIISEYTDYRSYLDYDIEIVSIDGKTQKFSKIYREKSGGETQTPYYVAIAASFVQMYSIGETIRIIMLDEAFDKMDEERIESMINFFKTQDLQIILAAPSSRLELIGEHADNIVMIYTDVDHNSFAEEFSYDEI